MEEKIEIALYIVRNKEGKYFRAKGQNGYGETWVDDIAKAKVYTKIGQARARASFFASKWPEYGVPQILKLNFSSYEILDEGERVAKMKKQREVREAKQKAQDKKYKLEVAQQQFEESKKKLKELTG